MKVIYQDEYGNNLLNHQLILDKGDMIEIDNEDWVVKNKFYYSTHDVLIITVTQGLLSSDTKSSDDIGGRLTEISRAIVDTNKRQDLQDKRTKSLREQTMSIRQHIRNQPKPKEI